jgi:hypothetical protein
MPDEPSPRTLPSWLAVAFVFIVALGVAVYFLAFRADCQPIPISELPVFESSSTLEERAARGEPFEKRDGRWQVCKSPLERAFFF